MDNLFRDTVAKKIEELQEYVDGACKKLDQKYWKMLEHYDYGGMIKGVEIGEDGKITRVTIGWDTIHTFGVRGSSTSIVEDVTDIANLIRALGYDDEPDPSSTFKNLKVTARKGSEAFLFNYSKKYVRKREPPTYRETWDSGAGISIQFPMSISNKIPAIAGRFVELFPSYKPSRPPLRDD